MTIKLKLGYICSILLCLLSILASCEEDDRELYRKQADRTVMAWLLASDSDSRLNEKLHQNIADMYVGLSKMDMSCTLLIYWDGMANDDYWPAPCLIKYETDGCGSVNGTRGLTNDGDISKTGVVLKTYPKQISTQMDVMINVMRDMRDAAPSDNLGLIIGSHGSGWLPTLSGTRSVGVDDSGKRSIRIPELSKILALSGLGKLDYLLFDDCSMGSVEVAYELRNEVKYCIASAMEIPLFGFPYEVITPYLYSMNVVDYTQKVCDAFVDYYVDQGSGYGTSAVIYCEALNALAAAMYKQITTQPELAANVNIDSFQQYGRDIPDIFGEMHGMKYASVDMLDFVSALNVGKVPIDFQSAFDDAVIYKTMVPGSSIGSLVIDPNHYSGLGMYIPYTNKTDWNYYFKNEISWCVAGGWSSTFI